MQYDFSGCICVLLLLNNQIKCQIYKKNIFGIGVYHDTYYSPDVNTQLDLAKELVGEGGTVVLYLCSWKIAINFAMASHFLALILMSSVLQRLKLAHMSSGRLELLNFNHYLISIIL